ncbi:MAG: exodeoxyribonuclease VII large subunit [Bacteroidales bacterium]|nr:exodeoxyribonuclease VII large subunit [Bacteroidales bacterium]
MSEIIHNKKVHLLSDFVVSISNAINKLYNGHYWIKAEISKLNFFQKSGHCYPELVQNSNGSPVASLSAFIHKFDYQKINRKFLETIGEPLKDGMEVLLYCKVYFSRTRGLKLTILDIDIDNIIGVQSLQKRDNINALKSEGVFAMNKQLVLPRIVKRLAIISVETGKGYADFMSIINNSKHCHFHTTLLNSVMMGERAVSEISASFRAILGMKDCFDAVCIIRAGGGDASLQCFNSLELARLVAKFPLPVLAGIGHATNETIVEMVSNLSFVTPSELANFLIDRNKIELEKFKQLVSDIYRNFQQRQSVNKHKLNMPVNNLRMKFNLAISHKNNKLTLYTNKLKASEKHLFFVKHQRVLIKQNGIVSKVRGFFAQKNEQLYSKSSGVMLKISERNQIFVGNKSVKSVSDIKIGDEVQFFTKDGVIIAEVKSVVKK